MLLRLNYRWFVLDISKTESLVIDEGKTNKTEFFFFLHRIKSKRKLSLTFHFSNQCLRYFCFLFHFLF